MSFRWATRCRLLGNLLRLAYKLAWWTLWTHAGLTCTFDWISFCVLCSRWTLRRSLPKLNPIKVRAQQNRNSLRWPWQLTVCGWKQLPDAQPSRGNSSLAERKGRLARQSQAQRLELGVSVQVVHGCGRSLTIWKFMLPIGKRLLIFDCATGSHCGVYLVGRA